MIRENYDLQKKKKWIKEIYINGALTQKWFIANETISSTAFKHTCIYRYLFGGGGGCTYFVLFLILILINTFYPCITNYGAGRQVFNNKESVATVCKLGVRDVCFIDVNNHVTIAGQTRNTSVFSFKLQHITKWN